MKHLIFFTFLLLSVITTEDVKAISTEIRPTTPTQIYGQKNAEIALVIGNGG